MFNPTPNNEPRKNQVKVRMSETEHAHVKKAAEKRLLSVSDYIRWTLTLAMKREQRNG